MTRALIATLLLLFGIPQGAPPSPPGVIEGRVVRTSTSEPVAGVQIALVPPAPPANPPSPGQTTPQAPQIPPGIQIIRNPDGTQVVQTANGTVIGQLPAGVTLNAQQIESIVSSGVARQITTITDSDGKFSFQNLAPGVYSLRAQRQGYFGPMTPQGTYAGGVAKTITVESNKTARADIGMVQGGVLRGLLKDPDGQPAANYAVVTARPGYVNGRLIGLLTGAMNADDRGEYRWPNFAPGEYYVGSGPRAPGPIANVQDSWARVFYPGVIDPNQARTVTIPEGGEVTVNLSAQLKPWGAYKISGMAYNPLPNLPADQATGVVNHATALVLMPLDLTLLDNPPVTLWTGLVASNTKPNGEFILTNVDPGRYELYAMAQDVQNRRVWTGHMRVEVRDKDLSGLTIAVSPGVTLRGEMTFSGPGAAAVHPEALRISLQALGTLPPQVTNAIGTVVVDEKGKIEIANLSEGRYRMNVQTPPGAYVASILQGSTNVFNDGFSFDTQNADLPIRIEINMAGETVEGNVRITESKDAPNAMVVLVPAPAQRNNPALYKTAVTDDKGHFTIRGVAPGLYTAFAWETVLPGAYQNAEFLDKYQSRSRPVNVQAGTRSEVQLDLIQGN
ncbi:MAG TPA: carboxypeptidase regulatory-like domain-containing protein [Terriglobia bacterium]|nr:carboxypeptidase regulatory-like domain-containing protein [Terriglobia bacterium]